MRRRGSFDAQAAKAFSCKSFSECIRFGRAPAFRRRKILVLVGFENGTVRVSSFFLDNTLDYLADIVFIVLFAKFGIADLYLELAAFLMGITVRMIFEMTEVGCSLYWSL
jgi:hypothetical protein